MTHTSDVYLEGADWEKEDENSHSKKLKCGTLRATLAEDGFWEASFTDGNGGFEFIEAFETAEIAMKKANEYIQNKFFS